MLHVDLQTLVGVAALLTTATPYIAALFTQSHYSRWVNEAIAIALSTLFGVLSWFAAGGSFHDVHDIGSLFAVVGSVNLGSKAYYKALAKSSPTLSAIEWWTGGRQAGFSAPDHSFGAATPVAGEDLPLHSTDTTPVTIPLSTEPDMSDFPSLPDPIVTKEDVPMGDAVTPSLTEPTIPAAETEINDAH